GEQRTPAEPAAGSRGAPYVPDGPPGGGQGERPVAAARKPVVPDVDDRLPATGTRRSSGVVSPLNQLLVQRASESKTSSTPGTGCEKSIIGGKIFVSSFLKYVSNSDVEAANR